MARVRIPNQKSSYLELNKRLGKYVGLVQSVFDGVTKDVARIATQTGYDNSDGKDFSFAHYPTAKTAVRELQQTFVSQLSSIIYRGTSEEWNNSNLHCDLLADKVLGSYGVRTKSGARYKKYYQTNSDALKAFQQRKIGGMNLSKNLWSQAEDMKTEMEYCISSALQKGTSAVTLAKRVSKYLNNFDELKADYKEKFGRATKCIDSEYRSVRLARSEINMAYRTAEQERWRQMDFVVGYEICLSGMHPMHDVCDALAGKYPKDFKWTGWHPNDMCYCVPILKTEDEFFEMQESMEDLEKRTVLFGDNAEHQEAVKRVVLDLENEYGVKLTELKIGSNVKQQVHGHSQKLEMTVCQKDMPEAYKTVKGVRVNTNVFGEDAVTYHEYGHVLTADVEPWFWSPESYKEYSKKLSSSLNAAEKKSLYEKYLQSAEKGLKRLEESGFLDTAKELHEIWNEYKQADAKLWVSIYSTSKEKEFFAECFAHVKKNGYGSNPYADRVCRLLDNHYIGNRTVKSAVKTVDDVPNEFKAWCIANKEKIETSKHLPYFVKDNMKYVNDAKNTYINMTVEEKKSFDLVVAKVKEITNKYGNEVYFDGLLDELSLLKIRSKEKAIEYFEKIDENILSKVKNKQTFEMTNSIAVQMKEKRYLGIKDATTFAKEYKSSVVKKLDITNSDNTLDKFCQNKGISIEKRIVLISDSGNVQMVCDGHKVGSKNKEDVFLFRRFYEKNGNRVSLVIDDLYLPKDLQDRGNSKQLFNILLRECGEIGATDIKLTATDVGSYVWARYGFCADIKDAFRIVQGSINISEVEKDIASTVLRAWSKVNKTTEKFPMKLLSDLPFGKKLLKGERWDGYFDLKDDVSLNYLRDYLKIRK